MLSLVCLTLFVAAKLPNQNDTKVWISDDIKYIKIQIETYSKFGYKIQSITAQSVGISESVCQLTHAHELNKVKGDLILIMSK